MGDDMKSEGSQHINVWFDKSIKTRLSGDESRIMEEIGNIKGLEKDDVKNYILIPSRVKDKDGIEHTVSWNIHELHEDCECRFKFNEDDKKFTD